MAFITDRKKALQCVEFMKEKEASMAIFCTASHWNTEAILLAAERFARKREIKQIPISVAMTVNYKNMPQAKRVTYTGNAKVGFLSIMEHLRVLCAADDSPYSRVTVLPHLDHADPQKDIWALTECVPYLASVMFDAQAYTLEDNISMISDYIKRYGHQVLVEGVMEELAVEGKHQSRKESDYIEKAIDYCKSTGVDFFVADLGTEQQSSSRGKCEYLSSRAKELTKGLGKNMLVLHGTSCLSDYQMRSIPKDGIVRVNMWTRIAREAGKYASEKLNERMEQVKMGDFEAVESRQYIYDSIEKAADIMENTLEILGYENLT